MRFIFFSVFLIFSMPIFSQSLKMSSLVSELNKNGMVEGVIYDSENVTEPLIFAEVIVKEINTVATTNIEGVFNLSLKPGKYTLIFGFPGYKTVEVNNVEVLSNTTTNLNQVLNPLRVDNAISEIDINSKVK